MTWIEFLDNNAFGIGVVIVMCCFFLSLAWSDRGGKND